MSDEHPLEKLLRDAKERDDAIAHVVLVCDRCALGGLRPWRDLGDDVSPPEGSMIGFGPVLWSAIAGGAED